MFVSGVSGFSFERLFGNQEQKKNNPKRKFSGGISRGRPGVIRAGVGSKTSGRPSKPWKNKHLGVVRIHDPNARTSMIPAGWKNNFGQKTFRNARLFIILLARNFWRVCSQFWLSVRNSV